MSVGFQGALLAQTKTVTGTVTGGDDGLGIPRANVKVKGTTRGTPTDLDGNYTIEVSADETLAFSFIGYTSQEILVGNQTTINVVLQPDVSELDEIVVVGYGSQQKKEITSAVTSIKPDDFNKGNISNPSQLLQGKVAGLSITRPGGDPNGGFNIRLRGISTFGANTQPLVVLDGVPGADLASVDPSDIASIDVLKDASAAAIYGARASSGVILITTTNSGSGKPRTNISFNSFGSISTIANTVDVLSAEEFVARGGNDFGSETDWVDELTENAYSYTTNVSVSGSSGNSSYLASVNWRNNNGIVSGTNNERLNTRLNFNHSAINDRLRLNVSVATTNTSFESVNSGAFRYGVIYNPTAPVTDDNNTVNDGGFFQRNLFDFFNPIALQKQQLFGGTNKNLLTSFKADFDITDNLTISGQYSQNIGSSLRGGYFGRQDPQTGFGQQGLAQRNIDDSRTEVITGTLNWTKELSSDLNMTALIGVEQQNRTFEGFFAQSRQFLFDSNTWNNLRGGANVRIGDVSSYRSEDVLNSAFARVNLNYQNTYFLSASVRGESFSGFGPDEKTGYFPAVSVGAELTELADLGPFQSLKLRVSYGITGALPPSNELALPAFGNGNVVETEFGDRVALPQVRNANRFLKWEEKKEFNIGVDYSMFDGKLTGTMDYYTKNVEDLIFQVEVPIGAPNPFDPGRFNTTGSTFINLADLQAGGFEFAASYNNVKIGKVNWTSSMNFTIYDKTTIQSLSSEQGLGFERLRFATPGSPGQNNNPIIENAVGATLGNFYGPRFLGVNEANEAVLSADINSPEDFEVIGNALPDGDFGWNNAFTLDNWSFNFFVRGSFGHELYNSYRGFYENQDSGSNTWNSVVTDKTPTIVSTPTFSDLYIEDASFIRLDNLELGYNFDTNIDWMSNLRVYFAAQNLFTITNYTGIDPEVRYTDSENGNGFTSALSPGLERRGTYFTTTTYTLGLSLNLK